MPIDNTLSAKTEKDVEALLNVFKQAEVDIAKLEAVTLKSKQNGVFATIRTSLHAVEDFVSKIENPANADALLEILNTLSSLSPTLHKKVQSSGLHNVTKQDMLADDRKFTQIKTFILQLLNSAAANEIQATELADALKKYYRNKENSAAKAQAKKLRKCTGVGRHHETAQNEYDDLGSTSIDNKRSQAMFDPVKVIGHLLSTLVYLNYVAPLMNKLYPNVHFEHKHVNLQDEAQIKLNNQQYGADLAPGAVAPSAAIPTAGRPVA